MLISKENLKLIKGRIYSADLSKVLSSDSTTWIDLKPERTVYLGTLNAEGFDFDEFLNQDYNKPDFFSAPKETPEETEAQEKLEQEIWVEFATGMKKVSRIENVVPIYSDEDVLLGANLTLVFENWIDDSGVDCE